MSVEIGKTYDRLTVLYKCEEGYVSPSGYKMSKFHVQCNCEKKTEFDVIGGSLTSGNTRSCGCLNLEYATNVLAKKGEKTRYKKLYDKLPEYDLSGEYGIGYTCDNHTKFYFDLEDYDKIKDYYWKVKDSGYIFSKQEKGKAIYLHRLVVDCNDPNKDVDHVFHNLEDCRKENLRICEHYENIISSKTRSDNTSGKKGVSYDSERNKWMASITRNKKTYFLGRFSNFEDAVKAREDAEEIYHKEYNYIDPKDGKYPITP